MNENFNKKIFIISGPSGVGKTTIGNYVIDADDLDFEKIITTTTREPRADEFYGIHYYFVDDEKFKRQIEAGKFIEYALVHGKYYGSTYEELDRIFSDGKIPFYIVDHQGAVFLKEKLSKEYIVKLILLVPPNEDELINRLKQRGTESEEEIKIRLQDSKKQLQYKDVYDYQIVNNDLEDAIEKFIKIINND
ncbi:guanylate kinase [Candidatus Vampirococcus lugosii]|uniref:Guanylate kinase n=1 Tax=Candidatus Vampirococcus lugosii TaxID=2789015 RepID=A0ABS5QKC7_9BACT|nr:guanylate kinase [Candidatus Vampirococcus lugosii]MBS8121691.1 Guanylate kinase [Candidatus Vampirococcus lugosii]